MILHLSLLLCTLHHCLSVPSNSSVKARVNLSALQFFSKTGHHIVDEEIPKIQIPNVTIPIKAGPGAGNVSAYNMNIVKFKSPRFNFDLNEDGIFWKSQEGTVKILGDWKAEYTLLVPLHESGWVQALATDIRVSLGASVFEKDGKPQLRIGQCKADIGHLEIEIGGGVLPWLVNLFRSDISEAIRKLIHKQACESARSIVKLEANAFLLALPSHIPIGKNFFVDYSLDKTPQFTSRFVEADLSADVVYGNLSCVGTRAEEWKDAGTNPRMVTFWLSESVPNCLLKSAHVGKLVQFTVTKKIPQIAPYLRTSCSFLSICIGRFFSKLKKEYPNQYVDLHFHTYNAPLLIFEKDDVRLNATFAVDIHLNPRSKYPNPLARLVLESSSSVVPALNNRHLIGNLNQTSITVREDFSTIGEMSKSFLSMFEHVFALTTRVLAESILHKGIPLPVLDNVTFSDQSEIHIFNKYIRLNIDFEFE